MAPEIIKGHTYNERVDIWSIGVITYMLLSGKNPFPGETKDQVRRLIVAPEPVDLESEKLSMVSIGAKDFLSKSMNKDARKRASAKQLLDHPWIKEMIGMSPRRELKSDDQLQILGNLQTFAKANKFQKSILSVMMGLTSDRKELKRVKRAFQKMDLDNDGHLSPEELRAAEKDLKVIGLGIKWNDILK